MRKLFLPIVALILIASMAFFAGCGTTSGNEDGKTDDVIDNNVPDDTNNDITNDSSTNGDAPSDGGSGDDTPGTDTPATDGSEESADSTAPEDTEPEEEETPEHHVKDGVCTKCGETFKSSNGLKFELNADEKSYTLVSLGDCADDEVIINYYNDLPVTVIKEKAFYNRTFPDVIRIGNTIKTIENNAFENCLVDEIIFEENSRLETIGDSAFLACAYLLKINIPSSVKSIGENAFKNCVLLESAIFEEGSKITSISNYAFAHCSQLSKVKLPDTITSIGEYAFNMCVKLISIDIPSSVKTIGAYAFEQCAGLLYLNLAEDCQLETIGQLAFYRSGFRKLNLPASLVRIENMAFGNCSYLETVEFAENSKLELIGSGAFTYCTKLQVINIPSSVKYIEAAAFQRCQMIDELIFAEDSKLESIGRFAFKDCKFSNVIYIPASVTDISEAAFAVSRCGGITVDSKNTKYYVKNNCLIEKDSKTLIKGFNDSIVPNDGSVERIGEYAFFNCTKLTSVELPNSVTYINNYAFENCTSLSDIVLPNSLTFIGMEIFKDCEAINYTTESNCRYLGNSDNPYLYLDVIGINSREGYTISDKTRFIGSHVNWGSYKNIEVPSNIVFICSSAFDNPRLEGVTFADNSKLEYIGVQAFAGTKLATIELPASLKSIGSHAFAYCVGLKSVTFASSKTWNLEGVIDNERGTATLTAADLQDASKNAEYMVSTYVGCDWTRK